MDKEQLNRLLAQVHSELRNADSIDSDRKNALQRIADETQQAVDKEDGPEVGHLAARLKLELTQIEASHPSLTLSISELVDALSKIGI